MMTRRIAREEGIFAGNSAGAAMAGVLQLRRSLQEGRRRRRGLSRPRLALPGQDVQRRVDARKRASSKRRHDARDLVASACRGSLTIDRSRATVEEAVQLMSEHDFSQIPVTKRRPHRRLGERDASLRGDRAEPRRQGEPVETIMQPAFPFVDISTAHRAAGDDDHAGEPGGARPDFKTDNTFIITRRCPRRPSWRRRTPSSSCPCRRAGCRCRRSRTPSIAC